MAIARSLTALLLLLALPAAARGDGDEPATRSEPEALEHFLSRTSELADTGHVDQAVALLRARLENESDPAKRLALRGALGDAYLGLGDLGSALAQYDAIARDRPELGLAHFKRGQVLERRVETLPQAIEAYKQSLQRGYSARRVLARLGFCHKTISELGNGSEEERNRHRQQAAEYYEEALKINSQDVSALGNLADLHAEYGSPQKALSLYARLTGLKPDDPVVHARLGSLLLRLDKPEPARDALARAAQLAAEERRRAPEMRSHILRDTEATARLKLAEVLLSMNRSREAVRELHEVVALANCSDCRFTSEALQVSGQVAAERLEELEVPASPE